MNNPVSVALPTRIFLALADYLKRAGSERSPAEVAEIAIAQWIEQAQALAADGQMPCGRGYQWKSVFLPHGSALRMQYEGQTYHAEVVGDAIMFRGHTVSPAQMVNGIAGGTRNAWRDLWLRNPDEKTWTQAAARRRALARDAAGATATPTVGEVMAPAVQDMPANMRRIRELLELARTERQSGYTRRTDMIPEDFELAK